jgi:PAP2 superfamily
LKPWERAVSEIHANIAFIRPRPWLIPRSMACLLFPGARLWLLALVIFISDCLWLSLNDRISVAPVLLAQCTLAAVVAVILAVATSRSTLAYPRLHSIIMTALFALFAMPALLIFNHLVMSTKLPMVDGMMIAADRAVGFDWLDYAEAVASRPWIQLLLYWAYEGIHAAVAGCFVILLMLGRNREATELAGLLLVTGVAGSLIGVFFPAIAAMAMLGTAELARELPPLAGRAFVEPLLAMRSADLLMLDRGNLTGITALPSYHATLGVLCAYGMRGSWGTLLPMLAYAAVMIAATPIFGGHYLADIIAALMFSAAAIGIWRAYLEGWLLSAPMRFHASRPAIL